ncbi:lipoate--protein ligase family protein [Candidatus Woesearchaeota archaeon]|nr:lipoate--protein ligase family protein [Candidatus Woesearchaeota archaeon]
MRLRLIESGKGDAYFNMALDEAIMESVSKGISPPTLRLYAWNPPAVSIGYFQRLKKEVNVDVCAEKNISIVRRITGGGAVYHDREITYCFIIKEDSGIVSKNIIESYEQICRPLLYALESFGLHPIFAPVNDIIISGKKISGNAQTRRQGCILQHGTLLFDASIDNMFSCLNVPVEKSADKKVADPKDRVTTLRKILGSDVSEEQLRQNIIAGFKKHFSSEIFKSKASCAEIKRASFLAENRYKSKSWNLLR